MNQEQPSWYNEAIEREIDYIVIVYEKAEGFVFCPSNLEYPFRVGGDYGGNFPTNAEGALNHYHKYFNKAFSERVSWFIKYVEKVARNKDFSLDDLQIDSRSLRVIKGKWPW